MSGMASAVDRSARKVASARWASMSSRALRAANSAGPTEARSVTPDRGAWPGQLVPHVVDQRAQLRSGSAGDHQHIGVRRPVGPQPTVRGEPGLDTHPRSGTAGRLDEEDMGPRVADVQQPAGQLHRNAPSRHA